MNTQHTPGPWAFALEADGGFEITGVGGHQKSFGYVICARGEHRKSDETHANAKLIAAAPDLLNALELAMATLERVKPSRPCDSTQGTRDVCNAAIAKARGQQ